MNIWTGRFAWVSSSMHVRGFGTIWKEEMQVYKWKLRGSWRSGYKAASKAVQMLTESWSAEIRVSKHQWCITFHMRYTCTVGCSITAACMQELESLRLHNSILADSSVHLVSRNIILVSNHRNNSAYWCVEHADCFWTIATLRGLSFT